MKNRSVPTNVLLPHITYRDVAAATAWLTRVFGFVEHFHYGNIDGAQMHLGNAWIMLHSGRPGTATPIEAGVRTQSVTVIVADVESHYAHTQAEGGKIIERLHVTIYGEHQYGVEDLDGHIWIFSQHTQDLSPDEWGATVVNPLDQAP